MAHNEPPSDAPGGEETAPHCDPSILHAPGECQFCDLYPHWQALRELWCMNFTGQYDNDKAPCPSVYFREVGARDRWPGNTPEGWNRD